MLSDEPHPRASDDSPVLLSVVGLTKSFGRVRAVDALSLDVAAGEFVCLLGPSGCGKTTLLRLLAGFEAADSGHILIDGQDVSGEPPHRRPVNMMFQSYALFPHLSVAANVGYGLKRAGLPRRENAARTAELLALVALDGLDDRRPTDLSGGQRQRVALARALARRPRLLLLDEPLSALDRRLRETTQIELKALQRRLGTTFVVVTHDQAEAMAMADRIAIMDRGRLVEVGPPRTVYEHPASLFAATFLGDVNLVAGRVVERDARTCGVATALADRPLRVAASAAGGVEGAVTLAIRPERVVVEPTNVADGPNRICGTVSDAVFVGAATSLHVRHACGTTIVASIPTAGALGLGPGMPVTLHLPEDAIRLYPPADAVQTRPAR